MRLQQALEERGVTLRGLRAQLHERGLEVSVATLSYWASGRSLPTRRNSVEVVHALESLLELPPEHLAGVMRRASRDDRVLPHADALIPVLARLGLDNTLQRTRLAIHDTTLVGADHHARSVFTRQLLRAEVDGIDAWPVVVETMPGQQAWVEPVTGVLTGEAVPVLGTQLIVVPARLPRALARGEVVYTEHTVHFGPGGELAVRAGRAIPSSTALLVIEACFEGDAPTRLQRTWTDPQGTTTDQQATGSMLVDGDRVQCVIPDAPAGTHILNWDW